MTRDVQVIGADDQAVDALLVSWQQVSRAYAHYLEAMTEVGRRSDPAWATCEIEAALTFTGRRADYEHTFARTLVERLPLVLDALRSGAIDHHKARVFADHLADLTDAQIAVICARLLPRAPGWTTGQLSHRLLREVAAVDHQHTRKRYQKAVAERGVSGFLAPDGTATITAHGLTPSEAAAAADRLEALAAAVRRAGHPGSIHQIRADLFVRLLDGRYNGFATDQIVAAMLTDGPADPESDSSAAERAESHDHQDDDSPGTPAEGVRHGIEIRIGLATLLGLDDHPAELPGWGPILAQDARLLVSRQHAAEWCFAITDADGYLLHGGITRVRPRTASIGRCRGGAVEIHISEARLTELAGSPGLHRSGPHSSPASLASTQRGRPAPATATPVSTNMRAPASPTSGCAATSASATARAWRPAAGTPLARPTRTTPATTPSAAPRCAPTWRRCANGTT